MSADQADLPGGWRRPGRGGITHDEAANGEVVDPDLLRKEDSLAHIDFDLWVVGIDSFELRPNSRRAAIHLAEPEWGDRWLPCGGLEHVVEGRPLGQPFALHVDSAGMGLALVGKKPVAVNEIVIGI